MALTDHLDKLESVKDLKVGDRVRVTVSGWTGTIVGAKICHSGWKVQWDAPRFGATESRVLPSQLEKE